VFHRDCAEPGAIGRGRGNGLQVNEAQTERRGCDRERGGALRALDRQIRRAAGPRPRPLGAVVVDRDGHDVGVLAHTVARLGGGVEQDPVGRFRGRVRRHRARHPRVGSQRPRHSLDVGGHFEERRAHVLLDPRPGGGVAGAEAEDLERRAGENDEGGDGTAAREHTRDADAPIPRQRRSNRRLDHLIRRIHDV
jgi:hypothetical protein